MGINAFFFGSEVVKKYRQTKYSCGFVSGIRATDVNVYGDGRENGGLPVEMSEGDREKVREGLVDVEVVYSDRRFGEQVDVGFCKTVRGLTDRVLE